METQKCRNCNSEEYLWVNITEIVERTGYLEFLGPRYIHHTRCKCFECGKDFRSQQGEGTIVHARPV